MPVFAIGDIQGCFASLEKLLSRIGFAPERDRLLLVGDLVNRGPASLEVLRWARALEDRIAVVLGNHDLHLLRVVCGARKLKRKDTLASILEAPDRDDLIDWLRARPLMHEEGGVVMVHAGLHPRWSIEEARERAREGEAALRDRDWSDRLRAAYAGAPVPWAEDLTGCERLRAILAVFVRLRTCTPEGRLCEHYGPPEAAPAGCAPWFEIRGRRWRGSRILFGHWSTLGLRVSDEYIALDTGCVWGGKLSAVRLEDGAVYQVEAG
jgi:bis(5'-nucleosyl)-tetraphosphatase (symmetrical)